MKHFEVKENSISYRFIKQFSMDLYNPPKDFCTYWRHVILWSPLICLFYFIIIAFGLFVFGSLIYALFTGGINTVYLFLGLVAVFISIAAVVNLLVTYGDHIKSAILWVFNRGPKQFLTMIFYPIGMIISFLFVKTFDGISFLWSKLPKRKVTVTVTPKTTKPRQPSLIVQKYKAIKGKYCPMVTYVK